MVELIILTSMIFKFCGGKKGLMPLKDLFIPLHVIKVMLLYYIIS